MLLSNFLYNSHSTTITVVSIVNCITYLLHVTAFAIRYDIVTADGFVNIFTAATSAIPFRSQTLHTAATHSSSASVKTSEYIKIY